MAAVLATHSPTHPVRIDRFERELGRPVDRIELPGGPLGVDATDDLLDALAGKRALFARPGRLPARVFETADSLRIVAVHGSGYDHVDVAAATGAGVIVTNNPGAPGPAVVEHVFALAFSLLRDLPDRLDATAAGGWTGARGTVGELRGLTVGVVGLGTIGFEVARLAAAFGADVVGHDPYVAGERSSPVYPRVDRATVESEGIDLAGRAELFERADLVTLHVPLTGDTAGMVGPAELDALSGGYLLNTARGGIVDEDALVAAVERGDLAGVGLDVLDTEPPDDDHPLLGHPDVQVTPHVASATEGYLDRAATLAAGKVDAALAGERPDGVVNPGVFED